MPKKSLGTFRDSQRQRDPAFRTKVLLAYHGTGMILPQSKEYLPNSTNLDWHAKQVFRSPERGN